MMGFIGRALVGISLVFTPAISAHATTLTMAVRALPASLGNPFTSVGQPASEAWGAIFDALTYIDGKGTLQPALAVSWTATSSTEWVFQLREGVTFQNGEPFNAQAVIDTLSLLLSDAGRGYFVSPEVAGIAAMRSPDPYTLILTTKTPDAILPTRLSLISIVAPKAWATLGPDQFAQSPVGTGPFRVLGWGSGNRGRLAGFEKSWRAPRLQALEFRVIPESASRLQALMSGSADVATGLSPEDFTLLPAEGFKTYTIETAAVFAIALRNIGNPTSPLQEARVRKALNLAVDRQKIAQGIFNGTVKPASQGAQDNTFGFNPDLQPLAYDPARARQLLAEAGYPNGFSLNFDVLIGFAAADAALYQKVVDDLAQIGVKVTLRATPYATWLQKYTSGAWSDTDGFSARWDSGAYADTIRAITAASCDKPGPFFCAPELMADIRATNSTFEPERRRQQLQSIMARLRDDVAPAIWLVPANFYVATSDHLIHFTAREHGLRYDALDLMPKR
ncbi:MAG: hypothetical protein JNM81_01260 [Rhodospirillaceae bacterium]|nr:hypothetical protein [Rhodospirillaceae bacterium]